ncbi:MAG: collagen binding domain-containing protein [[Clostridium] scindens]
MTGIAYSPLLPKGTYWLKEIEAPKGHVMSKTVIQADVGENQETEIEVSNDPEVSLKIQKTDSVTGNVITEDTAPFRLKAQDDGGVWQWVQADPAVTTDGVVVFTGLVPGKAYQIYEFKSPAGYVPADLANGTLVTVVTLPSIKEDGYGEGLIYSEVVKNVPLKTYIRLIRPRILTATEQMFRLAARSYNCINAWITPGCGGRPLRVEKHLASAQTHGCAGGKCPVDGTAAMARGILAEGDYGRRPSADGRKSPDG